MNTFAPSKEVESLHFDNSFIRELPGDPLADKNPRQVHGACYSLVNPTRVADPKLLAYSREVADLLDFSPDFCGSSLFAQLFAGNKLLPEMEPFAMCYGGHQFGNWAGQLGDGRAINLGEIINKKKERWVLQLKGGGLTPYSRQADGLAVLRSSIREFLCSEAMFHLGIPTTRALSVITTGEEVLRDMFYDGHPKNEQGAVVCRVSPSFIRFGNFEILAARKEYGLLQQLIDYTIKTDFPHLGPPSTSTYLSWFNEICKTTAEMILHWMRVGFVHGVMNTDNMSILGLTIDYGPYGWLEGYDGGWTPNTTDAHGKRYCFSNQPHIGQWNLLQLANAIYPIIPDKKGLEHALGNYNDIFQQGWNEMMAAKLGLEVFQPETDDELIGQLIEILQLAETDMTIFFRNLSMISAQTDLISDPFALPPSLLDACYTPEDQSESYIRRMGGWLNSYIKRLQKDSRSAEARKTQMDRVNPQYVLRNYLAQQAIDKAEAGDPSMIVELLELVRRPYDEQPDKELFAKKRPEWARNKPGCSMLSCSS